MSNQFLGLLLSEMNKYLTLGDQKGFQPNVKKKKERASFRSLMLEEKKDIIDVFEPSFLLLNVFYLFPGPLKPDLRST